MKRLSGKMFVAVLAATILLPVIPRNAAAQEAKSVQPEAPAGPAIVAPTRMNVHAHSTSLRDHPFVRRGLLVPMPWWNLNEFGPAPRSTDPYRFRVYDGETFVNAIADGIGQVKSQGKTCIMGVSGSGNLWINPSWYVKGGTTTEKVIAGLLAGHFNPGREASMISQAMPAVKARLDARWKGARPDLAYHDIEGMLSPNDTAMWAAVKADPGVAALIVAEQKSVPSLTADAALYRMIRRCVAATLDTLWGGLVPPGKHAVWCSAGSVNRNHLYTLAGFGSLAAVDVPCSMRPYTTSNPADYAHLIDDLDLREMGRPFIPLVTVEAAKDYTQKMLEIARDRGITDVILFSGDGAEIGGLEQVLVAATAERRSVPLVLGACFNGKSLAVRFDRAVLDGGLGAGHVFVKHDGVMYRGTGAPGKAKNGTETLIWPMSVGAFGGTGAAPGEGEMALDADLVRAGGTNGTGATGAAGGIGSDRILSYPVLFGSF